MARKSTAACGACARFRSIALMSDWRDLASDKRQALLDSAEQQASQLLESMVSVNE